MTSKAKKAKTSVPDESDYDVLRQYILDCPHLKPDNEVIKAALAAIDRKERDEKLQKKFAAEKQETTSATAAKTNSVTDKRNISSKEDEEWEDVNPGTFDSNHRHNESRNENGNCQEDVEIIDNNMDDDSSSWLGKQLAEGAIADMAEYQAKARSPLASIAMALHAAMRSETLGFACTGIPAEKATCGFAAPVRELPKTQFLPKEWDKHACNNNQSQNRVILRYRKNGVGSVLLIVECTDSEDVTVKLMPTNIPEGESQLISFPLDQHINLDSFRQAYAHNGSFGIQPALHYKGLSSLMTNFAKTFDLGTIQDEKAELATASASSDQPFVNNLPPPNIGHDPSTSNRPSFPPPILVGNPTRPYDDRGPRIDSTFPLHRPTVGDFSGDLLGPGLDPLRVGGTPDNMGNLMGPNHPNFRGGGMSGVGQNSGFGMRPRFDPFGPPGGPTEIHPPPAPGNVPPGNPPPGNRRPGGSGEPNPDHLRPPNSLGNNHMFL